MRISEAWSAYEADKRLLGYSPHTLKAYQLQSELLIRHIGDKELTEVAFEELKVYLIVQGHLKPASLGHRVRFLKSFFRWAHEEGLINANPAAKLREPKMGKRIPKPLPEEDLETLTVHCQTPLEHALGLPVHYGLPYRGSARAQPPGHKLGYSFSYSAR